jgi:hypothetical protein
MNDEGVNGYAYMNDDASCTTYSVIFSAHTTETKSTGPPTSETEAFVTVRMGGIPTCGDSSYRDTRFEIKAPKLKDSLNEGATLSVEGSQGTSCDSSPDSLCEDDPLSVSFNVVLTPTGKPWKSHSQSRDSAGTTSTTFRSTYVDVTLDFSGTLIDGVPFIPEYSDGDISKVSTETIYVTKPH